MKYLILFILSLILNVNPVFGQQDPYRGTFVTIDGNFNLSLENQNLDYWGSLTYQNMVFTLSARMENGRLRGFMNIKGQNAQPSIFEAVWHNDFLYLATSSANIYIFEKTSSSTKKSAPPNNYSTPGNVAARNNTSNPVSKPTGVDGNAYSRIAGSKLYIYTKPNSLLSNQSTSSYTEIDFCSNGYFNDYSESTALVEGGSRDPNTGTYSANAGVAGTGNYNGSWTVGYGQLVLHYANGNTVQYPINQVLSGSWNRERTKFAMDWKKGNCK